MYVAIRDLQQLRAVPLQAVCFTGPSCLDSFLRLQQQSCHFPRRAHSCSQLVDTILFRRMPRHRRSDDGSRDSRTSAVGSKRQMRQKGQVQTERSLSSDSPRRSRSPIMRSTLSYPAAPSGVEKLDAPLASASEGIVDSNSTLGKNRLATGFRNAPTPASLAQTESDLNKHEDRPGGIYVASHDVIEISDDEQEEEMSEDEGEDLSDDDGGMLINVDRPQHRALPEFMDIDEDESKVTKASSVEGKVSRPRSSAGGTPSQASAGHHAHNQLQGDLDRYLNAFTPINAASTTSSSAVTKSLPHSGLRLSDLDSDQLELQLKYAYFDLDPHTIDCNHPAICLSCLQPGHFEESCPEVTCINCSAQHSSKLCPLVQRCAKCREKGHVAEHCRVGMKVNTVPCDICAGLGHVEQACRLRFFPASNSPRSTSQKLWISCAKCASKSHLVGDCPRANQSATARWSLKNFAPGSFINLGVQPDNLRMEDAAAHRGLRPEGLKIRGRAGLHSAGHSASTQAANDDDGDEPFLRPLVTDRNVPIWSVKVAVSKQHSGELKKSKSELVRVKLPTKIILTDFANALNKLRKNEGKSRIDFVYDR